MSEKLRKSEHSPSEYEQKNINDKILLNIRDIEQKIHILYNGKKSQRRILIMLREKGSITQREMTEKLNIKPASVSEVLAKLANKGYIIRVPSSIDKRTMVISLTEDGRKIADEAYQYRSLRIVEMLSCFDDEEKTTLLTLLEKMNTD